jgi:hypothetical protein
MPISVDWKVNVLDYAITSKMADAETAIERKIVECSKKKRKSSFVWKYFGYIEENGQINQKLVGCKLCNLIMPYSGNTTNLRSHLDRKHWNLVKHHNPSST